MTLKSVKVKQITFLWQSDLDVTLKLYLVTPQHYHMSFFLLDWDPVGVFR